MAVIVRQLLLLLVLTFQAKLTHSFNGNCTCIRYSATASQLRSAMYYVPYGSTLKPGQCFKAFFCIKSFAFVLQEDHRKSIIRNDVLEFKKCPKKQEDTMLKYTPSCPDIRSRIKWNATKPTKYQILKTPVEYFIVHHSSTKSCFTQFECDKLVQSIQKYHMQYKHFWDIGYNFLIGGNGVVYEGRGWLVQGAHTVGYNSKSIGICLLGDFQNKTIPTQKAVNSLKKMIRCAKEKAYINGNYILAGHRDFANTDCPGTNLYNIIKDWPHFIRK